MPDKKPKVIISADLEGVSGVSHPEQVYGDGQAYKDTLMRWSQELNAVVSGLREAGVEHILINDSHNHMRNLNNAMVPQAIVTTGWQRHFSMLTYIERAYDACFFVGYHAMAGATSVLSHTYRPKIIKQVYLNNVLVGEIGLNAALAGFYNVPVAFISGDEETCNEAKSLINEKIVPVVTKVSLSRYSVISFPFDITLKSLKLEAIRAMRERENWKVYKVTSPCTISVVFSESNHADACELIPDVKRISDTQIEYTHQLYPAVYKCFLAMCTLAASRDEVIT